LQIGKIAASTLIKLKLRIKITNRKGEKRREWSSFLIFFLPSSTFSPRNQLIRAQYGFLRGLSAIRRLGLFDSEDKIKVLIYQAAE
jgi:hypothetical protein